MSKAFEITGTLYNVGETGEYGVNKFRKREFTILVTGPDEKPEYPNHLKMELIKDKCESIDAFAMGQEIKISFNLNGRLWQGSGKPETCFNSLQAWKLEAMQAAPTQDQPQSYGGASTPAPQIPQFDPTDYSDSIPFACCAI